MQFNDNSDIVHYNHAVAMHGEHVATYTCMYGEISSEYAHAWL